MKILFSTLLLVLSAGSAFAQTQRGGAFYLPDSNALPPSTLEARVAKVVSLENERRTKAFTLSLDTHPQVLTEYQQFDGPHVLNQGPEGPINLFGGPALHAGADYILPEPTLARYNTDLLVYKFSGEKLIATEPFREFSVRKLQGETIQLTRIFFSESPREADLWPKRDWEGLIQKQPTGNKDVAASYRHLKGRPLHFGVGGLWASVYDKPRIEIRVSKSFLLELAKRGDAEIGLTGPNEIPAEIIILESAWLELVKQPMQFFEAEL